MIREVNKRLTTATRATFVSCLNITELKDIEKLANSTSETDLFIALFNRELIQDYNVMPLLEKIGAEPSLQSIRAILLEYQLSVQHIPKDF